MLLKDASERSTDVLSCQVWVRTYPFLHRGSLTTREFLVCRHWFIHLGWLGKVWESVHLFLQSRGSTIVWQAPSKDRVGARGLAGASAHRNSIMKGCGHVTLLLRFESPGQQPPRPGRQEVMGETSILTRPWSDPGQPGCTYAKQSPSFYPNRVESGAQLQSAPYSLLQLSIWTQQPRVQVLPPEAGGVPESQGWSHGQPHSTWPRTEAQISSWDPTGVHAHYHCLPYLICPPAHCQPVCHRPREASPHSQREEEAKEPVGAWGGQGGAPACRAGAEGRRRLSLASVR